MRKTTQALLLLLLFLLLLSIFLFRCTESSQAPDQASYQGPDLDRISQKAGEAFRYCKANNMNTDFCILIDMKIHSGRNRFFVWDFKNKKIKYSFLTSHGCGSNPWSSDVSRENPGFSNAMDSHLSSLGKYRIGERGYSNWGVHKKYLLRGLDKTNSNAMKRTIVLHSWDNIPDEEPYPAGTPEGWGCPAISNNSFLILDPLLKNHPKATLLWIFN